MTIVCPCLETKCLHKARSAHQWTVAGRCAQEEPRPHGRPFSVVPPPSSVVPGPSPAILQRATGAVTRHAHKVALSATIGPIEPAVGSWQVHGHGVGCYCSGTGACRAECRLLREGWHSSHMRLLLRERPVCLCYAAAPGSRLALRQPLPTVVGPKSVCRGAMMECTPQEGPWNVLERIRIALLQPRACCGERSKRVR